VLSQLAELVFPASCPGCGQRAEPVCPRCRGSLTAAPPLPSPRGLDELVARFAYVGVARELVARAKYRRRHAALAWLAAELVTVLPPGARGADLVVWAPTTVARRRTRGFDQAEILARRIAAAIDRPVVGALRRGAGDAQTGRARADRLGAPVFTVAAPERVQGRTVVLVDDVVTTGATMSAAAAALRSAGAEHVIGAAVARRP